MKPGVHNLAIVWVILVLGLHVVHGDVESLDGEWSTNVDDTETQTHITSNKHDPTQVQCMRDASDGSVVCDCGNVKSRLSLPALRDFGEHFRIRNCMALHIPGASFARTAFVRSVHFTDVASLTFERGSLEFQPTQRTDPDLPLQSRQQALGPDFDVRPRGISIVFRNVRIESLVSHAMHGRIDEVLFDNCHVMEIHSFAISPTQGDMLALTMQHSVVERVMGRHVLKKFAVGQMTVLNSTFVHALPSGWVYEVVVTERLRILDSRFGEVLPNAFQFEAVRAFDLLNNRIDTLNGTGFHMTIADRCTIRGNNITALSDTGFLGIRSSYQQRPQYNLHFQPPEFVFADNRLGNAAPLDFRLRLFDDAFNVQLTHLEFWTPVTCDEIIDAVATLSEFYRTHGDRIYLRQCQQCDELESYTHLHENRCRADRTLAYALGGVGVMLLLLVLTGLTVWWLHRRRQAALQRMTVVQPEPRTYRETQIVIQIENAGLLKTDL